MSDTTTLASTCTGTLLSILPNIETAEVLKTVFIAALGASASFLVSQVLKWLWKQWF